MSHKLHNIEELLEAMGSQEQSADPEHRYQLRRNLMCSRLFVDVCERPVSRWDRVMTYTAPLVAGGMIVSVFAFMTVYAPVEPEIGLQTPVRVSSEMSGVAVLADVVPLKAEDFLSDPKEPRVSLADFVLNKQEVHYSPLTSYQYIRTQ